MPVSVERDGSDSSPSDESSVSELDDISITASRDNLLAFVILYLVSCVDMASYFEW